jgi:uncharacterized protein (DUF427 family)
VFGGQTIVETTNARRVLETSHPPVYYIPIQDVKEGVLIPAERGSFCEWKGNASYYHVRVGESLTENSAWGYPNPTPAFSSIRDHVAFYPHLMDACYVDGERVQAQAGGFYGGWITKDIVGPFKGEPGTHGW